MDHCGTDDYKPKNQKWPYRQNFWMIIMMLGFALGWTASPPSAMAGGVGGGACTALIAQYGCLAQAFGCVAPPYPCTIFDNSKLQKAIKQWVTEKGINMLLQLIQDGRVDWNRTLGGIIKDFSQGSALKVPDLTPALPYTVPENDAAQAATEVTDPFAKKACDLCLSFVSPKYPTGSTQERQQITANRQDAMTACSIRMMASTKWAQQALVEHHKNFPTLEQLSKKVCGAKNVGTVNCNKALEIELEKHAEEGEKILAEVNAVKSVCDTLKSFDAINYREGGVQSLCANFCQGG
jgi:hypothetical protein